jgi:hypothetical protein
MTDQPVIECPLCAGTGKVRVSVPPLSPYGPSTFFSIDAVTIDPDAISTVYGT